MANELASRLGYKNVEFTTVLPDNRKELLLEGKVDALIACYSIAETRLENFDFCPAYYDDKVIAVVQNSSLFETIEDLKGCTFGTMSGANAAPLLSIKLYEIGFSDGEVRSANEDNSDVQFDPGVWSKYPSYQELSDALEEGEVDAMVLDGAIAQTYMNDERHILDDFVVEEQSFGVATQKGSDLSPKVADAI
ncbi:transporter substrate-binding domain-containing protein [Collinsella tanakaei]|uniref:transporter substrate-binding domain-containing protein n=1 Tax=Collinsella tanakaei TaxID=626935 RepID=UPI002E1CDF31